MTLPISATDLTPAVRDSTIDRILARWRSDADEQFLNSAFMQLVIKTVEEYSNEHGDKTQQAFASRVLAVEKVAHIGLDVDRRRVISELPGIASAPQLHELLADHNYHVAQAVAVLSVCFQLIWEEDHPGRDHGPTIHEVAAGVERVG